MCKLIVKNKTKNYINFNPLTQVVILPTVCHTALMMFVWKFGIILITCLLDIVLIL